MDLYFDFASSGEIRRADIFVHVRLENDSTRYGAKLLKLPKQLRPAGGQTVSRLELNLLRRCLGEGHFRTRLRTFRHRVPRSLLIEKTASPGAGGV